MIERLCHITMIILTITMITVEVASYDRPGVSARELLISRGYRAQMYKYITPDGYMISLTRGTNPLIEGGLSGLPNRDPILFMHGILEDSSVFLINSKEVRPKDLSSIDVMDAKQRESLLEEPSARSLPFLAMDLGHEVWLMNRRGFPDSRERVTAKRSLRLPEGYNFFPKNKWRTRDNYHEDAEQDCESHDYEDLHDYEYSGGHERSADYEQPLDYEERHEHWPDYEEYEFRGPRKNQNRESGQERFSLLPLLHLPGAILNYGQLFKNILLSLDRKYWNFSLDQQAVYDVPLAIRYICNLTGRARIATVSHSAGGTSLLMSLSLFPDLANNLSSSVLWSHAFSVGRARQYNQMQSFRSFLEGYLGPIPPVWFAPQLQGILGVICDLPFAPQGLCQFFNDFLNGPSGQKQPIYPEFTSTQFHSTSTREIAQFLQAGERGGIIHYYDYGPRINREVYQGQESPPSYNPGAIVSKSLSFYAADNDILVSPEDIKALMKQMNVTSNYREIKPGFNHVAYLFHEDNAKMIIIPTLQDLYGQTNCQPLVSKTDD